jgi:MerR family Zn(II)-responsive transcriptional regulator of zntA
MVKATCYDWTMRIGELAKRSGMSRDTIRFYERKGILGAPARSPKSGYRSYSERSLAALRRIRYAKGLGFTLAEIKQGLAAWLDGAVPPETRTARLREKLTAVKRAEELLARRRMALEAQIHAIETTGL